MPQRIVEFIWEELQSNRERRPSHRFWRDNVLHVPVWAQVHTSNWSQTLTKNFYGNGDKSGQESALFALRLHVVPPYWFIVRSETGHEFATSSDSKTSGFTRPRVIGFFADLFFPLWRADLKISGFTAEFAGCVWTSAVSGKKSCGFKNMRIRVDETLKGNKERSHNDTLNFPSGIRHFFFLTWSSQWRGVNKVRITKLKAKPTKNNNNNSNNNNNNNKNKNSYVLNFL